MNGLNKSRLWHLGGHVSRMKLSHILFTATYWSPSTERHDELFAIKSPRFFFYRDIQIDQFPLYTTYHLRASENQRISILKGQKQFGKKKEIPEGTSKLVSIIDFLINNNIISQICGVYGIL
jgi:hypothetical protein